MSYTPIEIKQNGVVVGYATKSMDLVGDDVTELLSGFLEL